MAKFEVGDEVSWQWGEGTAQGTIVERYTEKVTKTLRGTEVTRNASDDEPAFLIEQSDGDQVLKSITEFDPT